ncbi:SGNH/GDSL hydrolase family protein [Rhodocytophaga aerolata]|uniref:SGNH/GDSL hydrolase family protein n=1 Tax=Rhodocytophaga aerolata TaxID=455078 RepID=A0ABT8RB67_9BACT|nr:SGNH/GDSL hydrolase family protein [Rhodocytophaga aerolata]MDO1449339.1 SGNH/GDSL hydrolase family protein [Rhodocytophaga aerolata]
MFTYSRSIQKTLLLLATFLQSLAAFSQAPANYVWWNPAQHDFPVIEGQAWPNQLEHPYDRLPASAQQTVRKEVWNLSRQSAGLLIRFRASTDQVIIKYMVEGKHALPHMPATGVSGVDLYAVSSDGGYLWCAGKYTFGDTIQYSFTGLQPNDTYHPKGREYRLYLPLYNSVKWMQIGVPQGASFTPLPVRVDKPIVVYGTSIAQGACASRPGMAWPAIVGRKLDRPLINLGFSGNGRLEKEVVSLLAHIDAKLYILDCLPNLVASVGISPQEIKQRIIESVKILRQKRPTTSILLVEHAGYTEGLINPERRKLYQEVNALMREAFAQLKMESVEQLYLLPQSEINLSLDAMVDGTHPSDLGMQQYADAYEKRIRVILQEPIGTYTTMQPCTQSRDAKIYDWETRHRDILALTKTSPPEIIFIGNSITHYWAGQPEAPISRGKDSWNSLFASSKTQNLGYGWDRIENVLWRVYHEELDGYTANQVIILMGTNNLHLNSDREIVEGLKWLVQAIKIRQPKAAILLLGILPRRQEEQRISRLNEGIAQASGELNVTYAEPGRVLLTSEGKIDETLFTDGLHPNAEGYRKLAEKLSSPMKPAQQTGKRKK